MNQFYHTQIHNSVEKDIRPDSEVYALKARIVSIYTMMAHCLYRKRTF